ncbi:YfbM family protein [Nocardia takedensis]|uniref:YfbM family protein n=1 Tax=Nocardia takedensis TaxID=259390 RepID=UPI0002E3F7D8|nr:YfbM family protein [Nocardia takedensis]
MGIVATFTRVTEAELEKIAADPGAMADLLGDRGYDEKPNGYLDKAWAGLAYLFERACLGVELCYDGDLLCEEPALFGWSPDTVRYTADRLSHTPFTALACYFDAEDMDATEVYPPVWVRDGEELGLEYLGGHYTALVHFFTHAAKSNSAAIFSLG